MENGHYPRVFVNVSASLSHLYGDLYRAALGKGRGNVSCSAAIGNFNTLQAKNNLGNPSPLLDNNPG